MDMVAGSMESWCLASEAYGAAAFGASLAVLIVAPQATQGAAAVLAREVMVR